MRETRTTEFKETITNTFLKTVSAFSNYDGGEISFGIDDTGNIKGLSDVKQACLDIAPYIPLGKSKTTQLLKDMGKKDIVKIEGKGRGTKYVIK